MLVPFVLAVLYATRIRSGSVFSIVRGTDPDPAKWSGSGSITLLLRHKDMKDFRHCVGRTGLHRLMSERFWAAIAEREERGEKEILCLHLSPTFVHNLRNFMRVWCGKPAWIRRWRTVAVCSAGRSTRSWTRPQPSTSTPSAETFRMLTYSCKVVQLCAG